MGGNALKNCNTRRLSRDDFIPLQAEVISILRQMYPTSRVEPIPAYREKADFGDLDILIEFNAAVVTAPPFQTQFTCKEIAKNGDVLSIEHKEFQLDLIFIQPKHFDFALNYYSWNDCGNLEGRIAHKMGFKFGHDGLSMVLRDGDYQYANILVSTDFWKTIKFLGFDVERRKIGFDKMVDIFKYIAYSEYFNPDIYKYENRSYHARIRDKKRKTYHEFLEWLAVTECEYRYPWAELREQGGRAYKQQFIDIAEAYFPGLIAKINAANEKLARTRAAKVAFNGDIAHRLTGLTGKPLGQFMASFKAQFDDYETEIIKVDVEKMVTDHWKSLNKQI